MKILFVVAGTQRVAASRYRVYQYLPYLESRGIRCRVFSIISDFATQLVIRSPEFRKATRFLYYIFISVERFFRLWFVLFASSGFDVVFLQRATFPFGMEGLLRRLSKKIVFDIDDAIFLPDTPVKDVVAVFKAFIKEGELKGALKVSDCVIVENEYIREYVSRFCGNVHKIPGPIDAERYFVKKGERAEGRDVVLGWIGSPATTGYLHLLDEVFHVMLERFQNLKIVLIGAGDYHFPNNRLIKKRWSYDTEVAELQDFDIGLMPMPNDEWTKGKLGCKMLQYMAVGVPSIVSYTSTNAEIIKDGENGFMVKTKSEWLNRISCLVKEKDLRKRIGMAGRQTVEEKCSINKNAPRLVEILESLK